MATGNHTVFVNDFWEAGKTGYRYGFKNWTDGSVDNPRNITVVEDRTIAAYFYKKWCPGDVNGDGLVDIYDLSIVGIAYNSHRGDPNWDSRADLDCNGLIDIFDFTIVGLNYGNEYPDP